MIRYKNLLLFNFVPVIVVHLCFLPFWFTKNISFRTTITRLELGSVALLLLYMLIFNLTHSVRNKQFNFIPNICMMLAAFLLGEFLYYFNWGISTGNLFSPDAETLILSKMVAKNGSIAIIIVGTIWQVVLLLVKRSSQSKRAV